MFPLIPMLVLAAGVVPDVCISGPNKGPVIGAARGQDLVLLSPAGATSVVATFTAPPILESAGEYIVAAAPISPGSRVSEVRLVRDGRVLWKGRSASGIGGSVFPRLYLAPSGALALTSENGADGLVVSPDGTTRAMPGLRPESPLLADGSIYVNSSASDIHGALQEGFWLPSGKLAPLARTRCRDPLGGWSPMLVGSEVFYLAATGRRITRENGDECWAPTGELVVERPGTTRSIASPYG